MKREPIGIVGLIAGGSKGFQKMNAHLLNPPTISKANQNVIGEMVQTSNKKRIRQNSAGLNKTEQAFKEYLERSLYPSEKMMSQAVTLKLGNGVRYTPDFMCTVNAEDMDMAAFLTILYAYEVKGFMRDDAAVKIKVAASLYPFIQFHLVTRKGQGWQIDPVLP